MAATPDVLSTTTAIHALPEHISEAVMQAASGIVIVGSAQSVRPILYANPSFCRTTGYSLDELHGRDCGFLHAAHVGGADRALSAAFGEGRPVAADLTIYCKDGSSFPAHVVVSPVPADGGGHARHILVYSDSGAVACQDEGTPLHAELDRLTGLPDRKAIGADVERAVRLTDRAELAALLVVNIDHFKTVNLAHGYDAGDALLSLTAMRLRQCLRANSFLSRHGVDEFALVCGGLHNRSEVTSLAELVLKTVSQAYIVDEQPLRVSCSIGIALFPLDGAEPEALVRYANMALERAKDVGGNNIQFFSSELNERATERTNLEVALGKAVERDELALLYQPLVDLQSGRIAGFEALMRWNNPMHGQVLPARFIAVAEECGLIDAIGHWALVRACRDMRAWSDQGAPAAKVAVNVSPRQFRDPEFARRLEGVITDSGVDPCRLQLEITENVLMQDTQASEAALLRLKKLGVDLVLDDFGTGFSSLGYLKRFRFEKVKIDRSFVENVASDTDDGAIAKAVISMAHSLGIRVVAEGVETEQQCDFLRRNMCDEIQGFLFSRPVPADEARTLMESARALPPHLLRLSKPPRTLLLVDDEANILSALKRLLRRDNYMILTANSGLEGLEVLAQHQVDVIVSDQRMPGMTGVEFLGKAKEIYPDTVRIVLSGYTELQSVTDAVNQGAIYKFLTKPWDDVQLRGHIEEAFRRKEMADENRRLTLEVQTANFELAAANRMLGEVLDQQQQQIRRDEVSLDVVREMLRHVPLPIIGLDEEECVAFVNTSAQLLFGVGPSLLGADARLALPELLSVVQAVAEGLPSPFELEGKHFRVVSHWMGQGSESRGRLITLTPDQNVQ